jgi:hypothetical protein|tara:strand:+ start:4557 stop:5093 length:537 start_codon:yes stop_codon:yes gene_type:complete
VKNVDVPEPEPPGPWIEITELSKSGNVKNAVCRCGDHFSEYKKFRSNTDYNTASQELRERNQEAEAQQGFALGGGYLDDDDPAGGFRSRGPVLWMMHVQKMRQWYAEHDRCSLYDDDADAWDRFCSDWPDAPNCIGYDEWVQAGRPTSAEDAVSAGLLEARDYEDELPDDDDDDLGLF